MGSSCPSPRQARGRPTRGYSAAPLTRERWTTDFLIVDDMEDPQSGISSIGVVVTETGTPGTEPA